MSKLERLRLYETSIPNVDQTLANLPNLKYFRSVIKGVVKGFNKFKLIRFNDKEKKASIKSKENKPIISKKKIACKMLTYITKNV